MLLSLRTLCSARAPLRPSHPVLLHLALDLVGSRAQSDLSAKGALQAAVQAVGTVVPPDLLAYLQVAPYLLPLRAPCLSSQKSTQQLLRHCYL